MGCDCCEKSDYGKSECSASRKYRESFCGVLIGRERPNYDKSKAKRLKDTTKRRKKNKNKKTHRR